MAMIASEATAIASFGMKILLSHYMYTNLSEENSRKMRLCVLRAWDLHWFLKGRCRAARAAENNLQIVLFKVGGWVVKGIS